MNKINVTEAQSANGKAMRVVEGQGASLDVLKGWIAEHRESLEAEWLQHGTLRFRGFELLGPQDFEQVAAALEPDLKNDYLGTSPRNARSQYVFSASELPPYFPISQHSEMSFLPSAPRKLFFHCTIAPEKQGETPTVDWRAVWRDLPLDLREAFTARGVRYIRNYDGPESPKTRDLWQLKRWDEMFSTTDPQVAEQKATEQGLRCEWLPQGRLRLVNERPATRVHPVTGETAWFNHTQVFHVAAAALEYHRIRRHQKTLRAAFFDALTTSLTALKQRRVAAIEQPLHATHADGGEVEPRHVRTLVDTIWRHLVIEPWRVGDVLAIDNRSTGHGRLPFTGPREVLVAWTGV
ncbi:MAG: TauD/TfdA family dioxygenase [Pseudomonadota bacterium]